MTKESPTKKRVYKPPQRRPSQMTPEEFKETRLSLGMSQQELADLAGTGRISITRIENGKNRVNGLWRLVLKLLKERDDIEKFFNNKDKIEGNN